MQPTRQVRLYELGRSKPSAPAVTSAFTSPSPSSLSCVLMPDPISPYNNSHNSSGVHGNMSAERKPETPLQSPQTTFIASASSGVPSIVIGPAPSPPPIGDTASKSTRSSVDREQGGVYLPPGHQGSLTAYGKLREAAGTSANAMQSISTLEQLHSIENENCGKTADHDVSDTEHYKRTQIGRSSTPKLCHHRTGQQSSDSFVERFSSQGNPFGEYGNIGSPPKKGTNPLNPVPQNVLGQDNPYNETESVNYPTTHGKLTSQTLPQALKNISPPLVPGAGPWNESVWDNYWLNRPESMYRRHPDQKSVLVISNKGAIVDGKQYHNHNRLHTAQALSRGLMAITEDERAQNGLNARDLTVQVSRERATKDGFTGMTDLLTKSALNRRARQNWTDRSIGLSHYAMRMGNDPTSRTAKSEVINLSAVIDQCRDGSAPWLKDCRLCGRGELRAQIYKAVFGGEDGIFRQLNMQEFRSTMRVNGSWITLGALRRELFNVIEFMLDEMTDPETFTGRLSERPPRQPKPEDEDAHSSRQEDAEPSMQEDTRSLWQEDAQLLRQVAVPLSHPVARHVIPRYASTTKPLVKVSDLEAWHGPQVLSPTETHGAKYQMSLAESNESARYQAAPSEFSGQYPDIGVVSNQPPPNIDRQPVVPGPVLRGPMNHDGQVPMHQRGSQGFGSLPYKSGMQNMSSAPTFAYYIPYPMAPRIQSNYPVYGEPQYTDAFVQAPVPQQQYTAPHRYPSVAASGVNAGNRSLFAPEPSQQSSVFSPQHQETQRVSTAYHTGANTRNKEWSHRFGRQSSVQPSLPLLPYRPGSDDMFPTTIGGASVRLQELTRNGQPSLAMAMSRDIVPFAETAKNTKPAGWGVVKIGNIPYSLTKQEVLGFLGRNAKIVTPDLGVPIHIIMDRSTGKTMDCYVEFFSNGDASAAVNKCNTRGHQLRLGDRAVDVELSSQDELLKQLFPRAKNVVWEGGVPIIEASDEPFNTGFKSFVTGEEMVMVVRHAEQPHRSSYTQKCPQRAYECMISTLTKFPWFSVDNYTITTRDQVFAATRDQLKTLVNTMNRGGLPGLTENLLNDLLMAGLNAYGFSDRQRWELRQLAGMTGSKVPMSPLSQLWPLEAIGRKAGVDEDVVEFYANHLFLHPSTPPSDLPHNKLAVFQGNLGSRTMREVGAAEWELIEELLRGALAL